MAALTALDSGVRIEGKDRTALRKDVVRQYKAGASIRDMAQQTGRSYGFIYSLLQEGKVKFRPRGGNQSKAKSTKS
jgi:transposase